MNFKLRKTLAYVLMAVFVLGSVGQFDSSVKGETQQPITTMEEVKDEIPQQENGEVSDYIIMTNEDGSLEETMETVELTKETAEELQEKFDDVIIEEDIAVTANEEGSTQVLRDKKRLAETMEKLEIATLPNEKDIDVKVKQEIKRKKKAIFKQIQKGEKAAKENDETEWNLKVINAEKIETDTKNEKNRKLPYWIPVLIMLQGLIW